MNPEKPVISVANLQKRFNLEAGFFAPLGRYVYAVNGVSFAIGKNETYGLVGESGCGKTTTARLLVRMYEADEGEILFQGREKDSLYTSIQDVRKLKGLNLRRYRERVKYVFQDPARSLNPRMTVYEVLTSGASWSTERAAAVNKPDILAGRELSSREVSLREEAAAILEEVGLSPADLERRPAEFSGGQRQRISIARGLMMKPDLLICDEVVSALDVSIQGQILNLLLDLKSRREISFLFIAHDLKVASYFCDRIGVMYQGEIMEEAPAETLWKNGLHPYTELLFSSVVKNVNKPRGFNEIYSHPLRETPQSNNNFCAFASRCPYAEEKCFKKKPELQETGENHFLRCWR